MEPDQVNVLSPPVLGDFEQIQDAEEPRLPRQLWRNIGESDQLNRIYLDLAFFHSITAADPNVGMHPEAHARSDFSAAKAIAQPLGEGHEQSLTQVTSLSERVPVYMAGDVDAPILDLRKATSFGIISPAASFMGRLTRQNIRGGETQMRRGLLVSALGMMVLGGLASVHGLWGQEKKETMPEPTVKVGDMAPDFTLRDTHGQQVSLHDFRGKKNVALAFYIFAFTGG